MRKPAQFASAKLHNDFCASLPIIPVMETREKPLAFLKHIQERTGLSFSQIAKRAGIAASTINRYMEDDNPQEDLYGRTKDKIAVVGGYDSF